MIEDRVRTLAARVFASGSAIVAAILVAGWLTGSIGVFLTTAPLAWVGIVLGVSAAFCAPGSPTRLLAGLAAVGHAVVLAAWLVLLRSEAQGVGLDAVATAGAAWSTGWALAALVTTLRPHGTDDTTSADRVHA